MSTVLEFYSSKDLLHRTSVREGETKLGQILPTISEADFNADEPLNYRFVIVGIEEDYDLEKLTPRLKRASPAAAHLLRRAVGKKDGTDRLAEPNVETARDLTKYKQQVDWQCLPGTLCT